MHCKPDKKLPILAYPYLTFSFFQEDNNVIPLYFYLFLWTDALSTADFKTYFTYEALVLIVFIVH